MSVHANEHSGSAASWPRRGIAAALGGLVLAAVTVPASAQTVGRTHGAASVSASGGAGYTIPLWTPPGAGGLRPSLALVYSQGTDNGLLGVGWSIAGLSRISRCYKTIAQDGIDDAPTLDTADAYCLDGQRLRLESGTYGVAGSVYRTELESYARITAMGTAGNGPEWWEVRTKDGLILQYGNSADSRIESVGSSTPRVWAISSMRDRAGGTAAGNTARFTYLKDTVNGSYRPNEINYAYVRNNPQSFIDPLGFESKANDRPNSRPRDGDRSEAMAEIASEFSAMQGSYNFFLAYQTTGMTSGGVPPAWTMSGLEWLQFSRMNGFRGASGAFHVTLPDGVRQSVGGYWVDRPGGSVTQTGETDFVASGRRSVWVAARDYLATSTTNWVCSLACGKAWSGHPNDAFAPRRVTATNGERIVNTASTFLLAVPGGTAARRAAQPFAMGLDAGLDAFAAARGATTWKSFADPMNWKAGVVEKLSDPATMVHFNLDGVDVLRGVSRAAAGRGGATDWELMQIRQNPQWWGSVQFWRNGSPAANPFGP